MFSDNKTKIDSHTKIFAFLWIAEPFDITNFSGVWATNWFFIQIPNINSAVHGTYHVQNGCQLYDALYIIVKLCTLINNGKNVACY